MSLAAATVQDTLQLEFVSACADLRLARRALRSNDTPATRARLQECAERVDAVLDMSNGLARKRG